MTDPELARWLEAVRGLAEMAEQTALSCPHCTPAGHVDCALCEPVYHAAHLLLSYASLIRQVGVKGLPERIEE